MCINPYENPSPHMTRTLQQVASQVVEELYNSRRPRSIIFRYYTLHIPRQRYVGICIYIYIDIDAYWSINININSIILTYFDFTSAVFSGFVVKY